MKNRSSYAVLTRFGIIAAILGALVLIASAASATDVIEYAENGTGPVATLSATDPEGDDITWALAGGVDDGKFEIGEDTGVLTFKDPPDFEDAGDANETPDSAIASGAGDNMYQVSVKANDGDALALTVKVTDVDEPGTVGLDKPQPQVGREISAIDFKDPEGAEDDSIAITWWSGPAMDGPWTDLEHDKATYEPDEDDVGNYLRVLYTYDDHFGDDKTAEAVSDYPVEEKTLANARPKFTGDDASTTDTGFQVTRTSKEGAAKGSNVGEPISATDGDNDVLRYNIVEDAADADPGTDDEKFTIDDETGQLMIDTVLDFEPAGSVGATTTGTASQVYVVNVRVVDPSGADAVAEVRITLEDVNEPPIFDDDSDKRTTVYVAENPASGDEGLVFNESASATTASGDRDADDSGDDVTYEAADDDGTTTDSAVVYSLEPTSQTLFTIDSGTGVLSKATDTAVDYETKSSYSLTVIATTTRGTAPDTTSMYDSVSVTVKVVNTDDNGEVSFSEREPQVGSSVIASVDDLDGEVTNVAWQWYRLTDNTTHTAATVIADATTLPTDECTAPDATSPVLTNCVLSDATSASYTPVAGDFHADGRYLGARATYNDKFNEDDDKEIFFGVTTADVQEASSDNTAPEFGDQDLNMPGKQDEMVTRSIAENDTGEDKNVGDSFEATDGDMDLLMYQIGGPDADSFQLSDPVNTGNTINLQTKAALDYEAERGNEYTVTITAMDPSGATDTITVTVMVTDHNEGADIEGDDMVMYDENGEDAVATFTATDPEGDDIEWKLGSKGVDNDDFEIDESTGVLTFKDSPDYEMPTDRNEVDSVIEQGVGDRMYKVSITANGGPEHELTVEVENVDEPGSVGLDKPQPQVGIALMATGFMDPDGASDESIAWYSGPAMDGPWTDLEVTNPSYTPDADDVGNYLRVVYTYNDTFADGQTAEAVSDNPVEAKTLANARPKFAGDDADETADGFQVDRTSKEGAAKGSNVGEPISATDGDDDILRYNIVADVDTDDDGTVNDTSDDEKFTIDDETGQLKIGTVLDFEPAGSIASSQLYVVNVRVVDPSGADAVAVVRITLEDVNEPPIFDEDSDGRTTVYVAENADASNNTNVYNASANAALSVDASPTYDPADDDGDAVVYNADDDDGATDTVTYIREGSTDFAISETGGVLSKVGTATVNYEKKSSYSLTIIAKSTRGTGEDEVNKYDSVSVTVKVVNTDDDGTVSLTQREPQVGTSVTASVDDVDGDVSYVDWQWFRLNETNADAAAATPPTLTLPTEDCTAPDADTPVLTNCILGTTTATHSVTANDLGNATTGDVYLMARAAYNDKFNPQGETKVTAMKVSDAAVQEANAANTAPEFKDQDRNVPGVQDEMVTRTIMENLGDTNVGDAFEASDDNGDKLMYELGGPDAELFKLTDPARDGNSINLQTKDGLDYETATEHTVTITAMDPSGATDMITVTVMVEDENEGAEITLAPGGTPEPDHPCVAGGAVTADQGANMAADCQTLLDAMAELIGDGTAELNWSMETPIGDWDGIAERGSGRVGGIYLPDSGLAGVIPASFNDLVGLERLTLRDNDLTGGLPDLSALDNLEWLVLQRNSLSGEIPASLGDMDMLDVLWLNANDFTGGIPAGLSNSTTLRRIWLQDNMLTGEIPGELGDIARLRYLILSGNMLTGEIPADLANATNLKQLYLDGNMLTGMIPVELGNIMTDADDTLRRLYLNNNMLSGDVPSSLGMLTSLTHLRLAGNMLTGCIPADIFDAVDDDVGLSACQ